MIEKDVQDLLNPLVEERVFFSSAPQDTRKPYITIQQVGGSPLLFLEGPSGSDYARLQIDVYAAKLTEAASIMSQVRVALVPLQASAVGAPFTIEETAVGAFRRSCDFSLLAPA